MTIDQHLENLIAAHRLAVDHGHRVFAEMVRAPAGGQVRKMLDTADAQARQTFLRHLAAAGISEHMIARLTGSPAHVVRQALAGDRPDDPPPRAA